MPAAAYSWPLLSLAAFLVFLGLQKGWAASLGALLRQLANAIDSLPSFHVARVHIGFGGIAAAIRAADASVYHWIGLAIQATAAPFVTFVRYMADVFERPAQEAALLAADVLHTVTQLRRYIVPAMIAAHVAWIPRHLIALEHRIASLAARAPVHIIKQVEHATVTATKVVVSKAVAIPWPRIGRLEREGEALGKRIDRLARRVAPAALAAALVATVARTTFRWVRCARVNKVGRQVCGMDSDLLDSLLADTLLIAGTISLVEFAEGLQAGMGGIVPQVRHFWQVK